MSLQIIKAGLLDTVQDLGRYGQQHLGINPGGAMDNYAAQLANALLGKEFNSPVIEMHFPAPTILFEEETIICITGANFTPNINKKKVSLNQPIAVSKNAELHFEQKTSGARCYLSFLHDLDLEKWLSSYSTNLVAGAGGFKGRSLKNGDELRFKQNHKFNFLTDKKDFTLLSWRAGENILMRKEIRFIKGNEWDWLTNDSKKMFTETEFQITNNSNRMGYRMKGNTLELKEEKQLISSGVTFGTMQLLPNGQLIILMADHQTTGGYPRLANVISADLPLLAQKNPGDEIKFIEVDHAVTESAFIQQQRDLFQMQTASKFKIENLLHAM
jgi:antagonist of KipI